MTAAAAKAAGDRLDDVAYYGRTHDLRSDLSGTQSVAFYAVNAMGGPNGSGVAGLGGEIRWIRGSEQRIMPSTSQAHRPARIRRESKLGSGASTSNPEWDIDKDCVPDTYFDASEGGDSRRAN